MAIDWDSVYKKSNKDNNDETESNEFGAENAEYLARSIISKLSEDELTQRFATVSMEAILMAAIINTLKKSNPESSSILEEEFKKAAEKVFESEFYLKSKDTPERLKQSAHELVKKSEKHGSKSEFRELSNEFSRRVDKLLEEKEKAKEKFLDKLDEAAKSENIGFDELIELFNLLEVLAPISGVSDTITELGDKYQKKRTPNAFRSDHEFASTKRSKGNAVESVNLRIAAEYPDGEVVDLPDMFPATTRVEESLKVDDETLQGFLDQWSKEI